MKKYALRKLRQLCGSAADDGCNDCRQNDHQLYLAYSAKIQYEFWHFARNQSPLGESTESTKRHDHEALSTWGIGKELTLEQWRSVMRQLIARHVLWIDSANHNVVRLGALANNVLRGAMKIEVRRTVMAKAQKQSRFSSPERDEMLAQLSVQERQILRRSVFGGVI